MTRAALITAALALTLNVACSMDSTLTAFNDELALSDTGAFAGPDADMGAPPDQEGAQGGMEPMSCASDEDCGEQACPPEALDCVCAETPTGDAICVPGCVSDSDCPAGPQGEAMICESEQLVCVPEEML